MSLNHVVQCISKRPDERLDAELVPLVEWFLNMCPLKIKPDVAKDILRNCEFYKCLRDDIIIRQGDLGDCFYILLDGKVSVYINTEAVQDDPEDEAAAAAAAVAAAIATDDPSAAAAEAPPSTSSGGGRRVSAAVAAPSAASAAGRHELDRAKYGNYIVSFGSGKSFGELALINKDCVRNASIIADEATQLIVVNRDLYNRSLKVVQEAEHRERIEFVNSCDVFDNWPSRYKRQAAMSLRKETFSFDTPIVRQGEQLNGLYFIISGQAKIVLNLMLHYSQYPQLNWQDVDASLEASARELIHPEGRAQTAPHRPGRSQNTRPSRQKQQQQQQQQLKFNHQQQRHLELSLVGPGELIGDIEHGMELQTYAQSIVCTQPTEAFVLDAKNYERLVFNKRNSGRSQEVLAERARVKLSSRASRHLDWQVPLVRLLCRRIEAARRAEELRRQPPAKRQDFEVKDSDVSHFIPGRGALIDPYGPGTVFWRNRVKREKTRLVAKAKQQQQQQQPPKSASHPQEAGQQQQQPGGYHDDNEDEDAEAGDASRPQFPGGPSHSTRGGGGGRGFRDFDTSSEHLSDLERRLGNWFQSVDDTKSGAKPVAMNRFRNEDSHKIYPGRRVCMRRRQQQQQLQSRLPTEASGLWGVPVDDGDEDYAVGGGEDFGVEPGAAAVADEDVFITAQTEMIRSRLSSGSATGRSKTREHELGTGSAAQVLHRIGLSGAQGPPAAERTAAGGHQTPGHASHYLRLGLPPIDYNNNNNNNNPGSSHHRSSGQMWRSMTAAADATTATTSTLTPAERRENTAAMLKEILGNQTLPDNVKAALTDLQRMSTVLPDLDSCQLGTFPRTRSGFAGVKTGPDGRVCYRCRRHHLASTLL